MDVQAPSRLRTGDLVLAVLVLGMVGAVYAAVPRVFFVVDDIRHLVVMTNRGAAYFVVEPFGGHMLFARNAVFLVARALFGFNPEGYGWLALATHLLNVGLLFELALSVTRDRAAAAFAAASWGACALHRGTLEGHSVYGHALVGTLVLLVLRSIARDVGAGRTPSAMKSVTWVFLLLVASTCFGVGIGVAIVFPAVIGCVIERFWRQRVLLAAFALLPFIVCALYMANQWLYSKFESPPPLNLWMYYSTPWNDVEMLGHLCVVGLSGLVGAFPLASEAYPGTTGPWIAALFGAATVTMLVVSDARTRRWIAALLILVVGAYGVIAFGRANLSLVFGSNVTEAAKAFRYHYVGTIPLALIAAVSISEIARATRASVLPAGVLFVWFIGTVYLHSKTTWKVEDRAIARQEATSVLKNIDSRIDAAPVGSNVIIPWEPLPPGIMDWMGVYSEVPGNAALFVAAYPRNTVRGRHIYFVEPAEQQGVFKDPKNHRFSTLFVSANRGSTANARDRGS